MIFFPKKSAHEILPRTFGVAHDYHETLRRVKRRNRCHVDCWRCRLLIAESYDSDVKLVAYYGNGTHDGIPPFNFKFITRVRNSSYADHIKNTLDSWLKLLPTDTSTNWVVRT